MGCAFGFAFPLDGAAHYQFLNFIRISLFTIPGLSTPAPYGGKSRLITVDIDPKTLALHGLSASDVVTALSNSNTILPAGTARLGKTEYNIAMNASPSTIDQFNDIPIKVVNGATIRIGDVGKVADGFNPQTNIVHVNGNLATSLAIIKKSNASTLAVVNAAKDALPGIKAVAPGREVNVIGRAIESYARRFDYGVVRDFTGHGVGEAFHSGLIIPHYDAAPAYATEIEVGMVFTIEPMLTLGGIEWEMWADEWTVVTKDRSITAQFEHTMVVTERGAEILTLP